MQRRLPNLNFNSQWLLVALAVAGLGSLLPLVFSLSQQKTITLDEFQYAHASWLISQGLHPFRDFFEPHFPLLYQSLSVFWGFIENIPQNILVLRKAMLGPYLLAIIAAAYVSFSRRRVGFLIGVLFLVANYRFAKSMVEIRNDALAFSLFIFGLAILYVPKIRAQVRGLLSGLLIGVALWGTQKVGVYGLIFLAAFFVDVRRSPNETQYLGSWKHFILGFAIVWSIIATWLVSQGLVADWWRNCFVFIADDQVKYPGFLWSRFHRFIFSANWWMLALSIFGVIATVRSIKDRAKAGDPDTLLVALYFTTFLSAAVQVSAWEYSFIPYLGVMSIFAARGFLSLLEFDFARKETSLFFRSAVVLSFIVLLLNVSVQYKRGHSPQLVDFQVSRLAVLEQLTDTSDVGYDNSGTFITRPSAYYHYATWAGIRRNQAKKLVSEVPQAIRDKEAVFFIKDARWGDLPLPLKRFLSSNFVAYDDSIYFWGKRITTRRDTFRANRTGRYFVHPPEAAKTLSIGGAPLKGSVFELARGKHDIQSTSKEPFTIAWLPKTGLPFRPRPHRPPNPQLHHHF